MNQFGFLRVMPLPPVPSQEKKKKKEKVAKKKEEEVKKDKLSKLAHEALELMLDTNYPAAKKAYDELPSLEKAVQDKPQKYLDIYGSNSDFDKLERLLIKHEFSAVQIVLLRHRIMCLKPIRIWDGCDDGPHNHREYILTYVQLAEEEKALDTKVIATTVARWRKEICKRVEANNGETESTVDKQIADNPDLLKGKKYLKFLEEEKSAVDSSSSPTVLGKRLQQEEEEL
jgi:hypothetical protein